MTKPAAPRWWQVPSLGIRSWLALLVLGALLPAWGLAGFAAWRFAASERAGLVRDGQDAARAIGGIVEQELAALQASLQVLGTSPTLLSDDLAAFYLQASVFHGAEGVQVLVSDARGQVLLATRLPWGAPLPVITAPLPPGQLAPDPITGRPIVALERALDVPGHAGPLTLSITADAIWIWSQALRRAGLPQDWVVGLADPAMRIMARFPQPERFVGQAVHPAAVAALREAPPLALEGWSATAARDGMPVYMAWRRLPGPGWTVLVGVPRGAVDGAVRRSLLPVVLAGAVVLLALTIGLSLWGRERLARPLRLLESAASAVGAGDVPPGIRPTGVRELDAVARALLAAAHGRLARQLESENLATRLQAVMDHVPVGVALAEAPSRRIVLTNCQLDHLVGYDMAGRLSGLPPEGVGLRDLAGRAVAPEDYPLARAIATGAPSRGEFRYLRPDGRESWLRILAAPIRGASGQVVGAVAAATDVGTERRSAAALRESEQRFRTLAEVAANLVWSCQPDGAVDYVNPYFRSFTGQPPSPTAMPEVGPIHHTDLPGVQAAWEAARRDGTPYAAEYRLRRGDGAWRWFTARALPARGPDGAIRRWIGGATDVTELMETRQALERQVAAEAAARQAAVAAAEALAISELRFRRFAEASPDALWLYDPATDRLDYVSPAFEAMWGGPADAGAGLRGLLRGVAPADQPALAAALGPLAAGEPQDLEFSIRSADGRQRWVRLASFPVRDTLGAVLRVGGFARDVSARREADERQRLLIAELNHRVKNTLATVLSLSRHTARDAGAGEAAALDRFLADFQSRLMALARGHDVLTARTWGGAPLSEVAATALMPWCQQASDAARIRLPAAGASPSVWLVPKQALAFTLALHELATNASKHGALSVPGGRVMIGWHSLPDGLVELSWTERGGPPAREPARTGFGSRLLRRGLPAELGPGADVELHYGEAGFAATITFRPSDKGDEA